MEYFWAPDGLGPDLAAEAPAGNTPQKLQQQLIWSTFGLRTGPKLAQSGENGSEKLRSVSFQL